MEAVAAADLMQQVKPQARAVMVDTARVVAEARLLIMDLLPVRVVMVVVVWSLL